MTLPLPAPESAEPFDPFGWALDFVLRWEGGFVNDPADHGGATNRGITQATYNAWRKAKGKPLAPVRELGLTETRAIYRARYWDAVRGDDLAAIQPRMALCVFDAAVQSGPVVASKTFQRVVRTLPDGIIGPASLACYRLRRTERGDRPLLESYMDRRRGFYAAIVLRDPTQRKFSAGWRARRNALRQMVGLSPEED